MSFVARQQTFTMPLLWFSGRLTTGSGGSQNAVQNFAMPSAVSRKHKFKDITSHQALRLVSLCSLHEYTLSDIALISYVKNFTYRLHSPPTPLPTVRPAACTMKNVDRNGRANGCVLALKLYIFILTVNLLLPDY